MRLALCLGSTFYIGVVWKERKDWFKYSKNISNCIIVLLLPISCFLGYTLGRVDLYKMEFSDNLFYYYLLTIINLVLWIEISKKLESLSILKKLGQNTLLILGTHYYILFFLRVGYKVLKLSIELADKVGVTLCMANDPDADRIGVAVKDEKGEWIYPNGNQIGFLLMNYILENKKDIPKNSAVVSTVVSTPMLDIVAKEKGVKIFRTLTGFKFIGEKIREFEERKYDATFLMGFEESYRYLVGTHARDKDAVVSTLLIAEMAAYYNSIGSSIPKELKKLYEKFGYYREGIIAITKKRKDGVEAISKIIHILQLDLLEQNQK